MKEYDNKLGWILVYTKIPICEVYNQGKIEYKVPTEAHGNSLQLQFKTFKDIDQACIFATMVAHGLSIQHSQMKGLKPSDLESALMAVNMLRPFADEMDLSMEQAMSEYCHAKRLVGSLDLAQMAKDYLDLPWINKSKLLLNVAIDQFLAEKRKQGLRNSTLHTLRHILQRLAEESGKKATIISITAAHVHKVIHKPDRLPQTKRTYYFSFRMFFTWLQRNCYLRPDLQTAMDQIKSVAIQKPLFQAATVGQSKQILRALSDSGDLQLTMAASLALFAGLRFDEIHHMHWNDIVPGESIRLPITYSACGKQRYVPLHPVLDAWLKPFYGRQGLLVGVAEPKRKIYSILRKIDADWRLSGLRQAYIIHRLSSCNNVHQVAMECGYSQPVMSHHFHHAPTKEEANHFFSLTPEACGIHDWPGKVRIYLDATPEFHKLNSKPAA